ncbi:MAG: sugar phosphate isomerase/epimerase family protein [Planctomycetota bacterium]|jgi:sugar phosphate isomerase/epimerase
MFKDNIRIGTMAGKGNDTPEYIRKILPHGFESFQINFWKTLGDCDLERVAAETLEVLDGSDAVVSSVAIFGNPLKEDEEGEVARDGWVKLVDAAHLFKCDLVCGFAGRVVDAPAPESIPRYKEVFEPIAKQAADKGVRLAFENCDMGGNWRRGDWNIAHWPKIWEMMFDAFPSENVGLEWEPCHQMVHLIDPMPQLRKWVKKFFHIHGKDATVLWDVVREHGISGVERFAFHRTPGFGDSNWTDIISELRRGGFEGSIDIEGWHDPVYNGELEMTGQVHALNYLKRCRADFVENP